jgi:siroheme synthase-like protein
MGYFPFFIDIKDKKVFVAGGGPVAYRKCRTLLAFGCKITVFAKEVSPEFAKYTDISVVEGMLKQEDIRRLVTDFDVVIAATSMRTLNHTIASICQELHIPVNVADSQEESSFLFPAVVTRGDLTIGISTAGKAPALSAWLRAKLEQLIPSEAGQMVERLACYDKQLKEQKVPHRERGTQIKALLDREWKL